MVTTHYSDRQGSKSRQKLCCSTSNGTDQYQNGSSNLLTPYREHSQDQTLYRKNKNKNTEVHGGGGLELVEPAREPASSRPKSCASLKKPHESCPFAAPCGPRRKKNYLCQRSAFPSETSRFKPVILAHRGSALPWLVDDRSALHLR